MYLRIEYLESLVLFSINNLRFYYNNAQTEDLETHKEFDLEFISEFNEICLSRDYQLKEEVIKLEKQYLKKMFNLHTVFEENGFINK